MDTLFPDERNERMRRGRNNDTKPEGNFLFNLWSTTMAETPEFDEKWCQLEARRLFHEEGLLEIDEDALISRSPGNHGEGAYVQAWIWVERPKTSQEIARDVSD